MAKHEPEEPADPPLVGTGRRITPEEIRQVLMDEGYSASRGTDWVREVLTSVQNDETWTDDAEKERLIGEIKAILGDAQEGDEPLADDVL
jgi:hypothetical protein